MSLYLIYFLCYKVYLRFIYIGIFDINKNIVNNMKVISYQKIRYFIFRYNDLISNRHKVIS